MPNNLRIHAHFSQIFPKLIRKEKERTFIIEKMNRRMFDRIIKMGVNLMEMGKYMREHNQEISLKIK